MNRFRWLAAAALCLVLGFVSGAPLFSQNPNGFVQRDQWACLLPLHGSDCTGGGEEAMKESWISPHDLAAESPVIGTVWRDIDFGGSARSLGYLGTGDPTFVGLGRGTDPDVVDFNAYLQARRLPEDFVMGIAVTYVKNTTETPLPVGICTASDDSIQVWVNSSLVVNRSTCRAVSADCAEIDPAILAPGVNRVAVLVWEGYGGFGFRLGFTRPDNSKYAQGDPEIQCLGARAVTGAPSSLPVLSRLHPGSESFRPDDTHVVSLLGGDAFQESAVVRVCEEIGALTQPEDISRVSRGGTVEGIPPADVGDFHHATVGFPCGWNNNTTFDGSAYTTVATTGVDIWTGGDTLEYAYDYVEGDFDVSVEIVQTSFPPTGRWGKFGLMARQSLEYDSKFAHLQDHGPDLQDPARFARRVIHKVRASVEEPVTSAGLVDPENDEPLTHPRYMRLTRRGDAVEGWISQTAGDGDPRRDPASDKSWVHFYSDDWKGSPTSILLGFGYSVHYSSGCATGAITWRVIHYNARNKDPPPVGTRICWDAQGSTLKDPGLRYSVTAPRGEVVPVWGHAGGSQTMGPRLLHFQEAPSEPAGPFDAAHDIGSRGPCTRGDFTLDDNGTLDPADDAYTITASGVDIWIDGDQCHFAYKQLTGDFDIQARFTSVSPPLVGGRWGKYGLMTRWDCRPDSAYFFTHNAGATNFTCQIDAPRIAFRPRSGTNGGNEEPNMVWWQDVFGTEPLDRACAAVDPDPRANDDGLRGDERNMAPYLRMVRRGNTFYGYGSDDGLDWRTIGSFSFADAPGTVLVGVAATSHADCEPMSVTFTDVIISEPAPIERRIDGDALPGGTEVAREDFSSTTQGACPSGWACSRQGTGSFTPQVVGERLRLAEMRGAALGSGEDSAMTAFLKDPVDPSRAYLFEFDAYFFYDQAAAGDGNPPADGLTFCMLGTRTGSDFLDLRVGDTGSGLGFDRINLSRDEKQLRTKDASLNNFAVELDIWHGGETGNEGDGANVSGWNPTGGAEGTGTGAYHIGLDVNASRHSSQRNHQMGVLDDDLPDAFHPDGIHVRGLYDRGHVKVWVRSSAPDAGEVDTLVIDHEIEPVEFNSQEAFVGFTAGTGAATCRMEVDNFVLKDVTPDGVRFHRGDPNDDGTMNITDGIYVLNFLFLGGSAPPCREAADANDDGTVNITDGIFVLNFLFLGGPEPRSPGPPRQPCGFDPPGSPSLGCVAYTNC